MERIGAGLKGIYRDLLIGRDGRTILDRGWVSNTIVERCRVLLAGFVKHERVSGLHHLAVGQGRREWDDAPEAPPVWTTTLEAPHSPAIPLAQLRIDFLDGADEVVVEPTSRLQITATLEENYPPPIAGTKTYPLREFGLFARLGDKDYMLNCIRHPVIHKDASTRLVRVIRLYF